ncbi:MAG: NAD-glutamate dehydrogenase [Pseudomonadales bacterium]
MIGDNSAQIRLLLHAVAERLDGDDPLLMEFVRLWWSRIPEDDLLPRSAANDSAASIAAWREFRSRDPEATQIKVTNPSPARDGWHSSHTVVTVMTPDMPFVTDSVLMALSHDGLVTHHLGNVVLSTQRSDSGTVEAISNDRSWPIREVFIYAEIDRIGEEEVEALHKRLSAALADVRAAVSDFAAIKAVLTDLTEALRSAPPPLPPDDVAEALGFLEWLSQNNFTFLGYRSFDYRDDLIRQDDARVLGVIRNRRTATPRPLSGQRDRVQAFLLEPSVLAFSQSGTRSRVHRPAYPDYIGVRKFDADGRVIGEHGFLGLYTSRVYLERPERIPVVRRKVARVLERSGLDPAGFDGKVLSQVLATYPKDELFQISEDELFQTAMGITYIHERRRTRLFVRHDPYGLFVHCLIYLPRDRYSTQARLRIQEILVEAYQAQDAEFEPFFSESILVRLQINLRITPGARPEADPKALEARLVAVTRDWNADFQDALESRFGESRSRHVAREYALAFPAGYRERYDIATAVEDLDVIESLSSERVLASYFYRRPEDGADRAHLKLFHLGPSLVLSDVVATLENMGLRIHSEHPYHIERATEPSAALLDFDLELPQPLDLDGTGKRFNEAFGQIWRGDADNDRYNRLLLAAGLDWRQIQVLRTYARYLKQIRFGFSQQFISDTLCRYADIAADLVRYFETRFAPAADAAANAAANADEDAAAIEQRLVEAFDQVALLNEDRILRRYLALMQATLRTNHFRTDAQGRHRPFLSIKLKPGLIDDVPRPVPAFEIFVSSPQMEGVHLRGGPIARGGLRWSDRAEDYRTEVLGLVKAQTVKNAVIVPTGAKGGFIVRHPSDDRATFRTQGIACYQDFIRGLLDLTDNVVDGTLVHPDSVRCHDGEDPYLVVAADKGTATFSDTANAVAGEYGFWLGDAFASGGSNGYDHKQMGITARGGWVSVQRHFAERGIDVQSDPVTVLGIGDMSGDVFGNGMLLSRSILLVAAFNHQHVFLDPNPDAAAAFAERERLFGTPGSSWADYDQGLLSAGGGVHARSAKSISLTSEVRDRFGIDRERMSPDELISALLRSPVDLIWNGGIGTYVKAAAETHAEVGDRANDAVRVDAEALQAAVIGEGGNLGVTQRGRVAFALAGGAINTDFIDNSGGVDCSDHEVNIKIALDRLVMEGDLTAKHRNELLREMADEVAELVLTNNFRQAQLLSLAARQVRDHPMEYQRFIGLMEAQEQLDRTLEGLPTDELLQERVARGELLTRPELAVLMAFAKTHIKNALNRSSIADDADVRPCIYEPFPRLLETRHGAAIDAHRLAAQIVATQLANDVVHHMGITFVTHLMEFVGASVEDTVRAYLVAAECFGLRERFRQIEALPGVDAHTRLEALEELVWLGRRATRWLLRHERGNLHVGALVARYRNAIEALRGERDALSSASVQARRQQRLQRLLDHGVPADTADQLTGSADLSSALTVIAAAHASGVEPAELLCTYADLGRELDFPWLVDRLAAFPPTSYWQVIERDSLIDDLVMERGRLAAQVQQQGGGDVAAWLAGRTAFADAWRRAVELIQHAATADFSLYAVTCRKLIDLGRRSA